MQHEAAGWPFPGITPRRHTGERPPYFGFVINGNAGLGTLADLYGLKVPEGRRVRTFADYIATALAGSPRVGDRVALGVVELTVLEISGRRVDRIGLRFGRGGATPSETTARH